MGRYKAVTFAITVLFVISITSLLPLTEAKVTVHSITVTTDKESYILGSEAIAKAVLDFTGAKKDLLGVNFTWYYPNGTIAKLDPDVMPDGTGVAYSSWWPDALGNDFVVNATYTGDKAIYDEASFDVVTSPPYKEVGGPINVDTTWYLNESPYIVIDNVSVETGVTLTIEPGVMVEFKNETALTVNGTLIAIGNESNMITFTSNNTNPQPGDWRYIEFDNDDGSSMISYARIEYSYYGLKIVDSSPDITYNLIRDIMLDGIWAYKCSSYIAYNTITAIVYQYAGNKGINLLGDCSAEIHGNIITDVEEYGMKISNSDPVVSENFISGSYYNIYCYNSNAIINNNMLFDAQIDCIRVEDCLDVLITNNTVSDSKYKGIRCEGSSPIISHNLISNNGGTGIDDSGIWLYECQNMEISNNILEGNKFGIYIKNSNTLIIIDNELLNSTKDGIYSDDSYDIEILDNIIDGNENGINLKDSIGIISINNPISNNTGKAFLAYNSTNIEIQQNIMNSNEYGIFLQASYVTMTNSTIYSGTEADIFLTQNSKFISINSTFRPDKVLVSGDCQLIVKNYLHIFVQNYSYQPFQGTNVTVKDNELTVYSIQTDEKGMCRFLLLTDRIYNGNNTPTENITEVEVENGTVFLLKNPRDVDMSYSHVEVFSPGNPLSLQITSPLNQSLVFDVLNITGTASSLSGEINNVEINIDGGEWRSTIQTDGDWSFWRLELDTRGLSDDWHMIFARVSTPYHEKKTFIMVLVDNIGNKPPMVSITSHNSYDIVNGTIKLEGISYDYDGFVESVDINIDNGSWIATNNLNGNWSTWNININTTGYPDGMHNISILAFDNANENMTIHIALIFNNEAADGDGENGDGDGNGDEDGEGDGGMWWIVWILVIILIVIAMILTLKRRKKKESEEGEDRESESNTKSEDDL